MNGATRSLSRHGLVYVAGHRGLAGSAIYRALKRAGYTNVIGETHTRLDLTQARVVDRFVYESRPSVVILAAARVGGIIANAEAPADFIRDNLLIQTHVIDAAFRFGVSKLVFLGSSWGGAPSVVWGQPPRRPRRTRPPRWRPVARVRRFGTDSVHMSAILIPRHG